MDEYERGLRGEHRSVLDEILSTEQDQKDYERGIRDGERNADLAKAIREELEDDYLADSITITNSDPRRKPGPILSILIFAFDGDNSDTWSDYLYPLFSPPLFIAGAYLISISSVGSFVWCLGLALCAGGGIGVLFWIRFFVVVGIVGAIIGGVLWGLYSLVVHWLANPI